ncbi:MAG TPA: nucleoside triphosphate pyrophosphohydrolase [Bryobacterales bacterium]|nr:nucleoside triphosphate pyrophosphohydrolase [Bryobacterales bacterium]
MPGEKFQKLVGIMARLRGPNGCPWDREQTFDTIKSYLLEETYEVIDAIDRRDWQELAAELGDLQLQVVFFSQMAAEEGRFTIDDVLDRICDKLIRRHPHVFGDETAATAGEVLKRWNELKAEEKGAQSPPALLDGVPRAMPALLEAYQLTSRASQVGFDWQRFEDLLAKLEEELGELEQARSGTGDRARVEDELGDLLFMMVNIVRFLKFDPELALRKTNQKFRRRFAHVEQGLQEHGKTFQQAGLEEMEELWQQAKKK